MPLDSNPPTLRDFQRLERDRFVYALRTTPRRQSRGDYGSRHEGTACAFGVYVFDVLNMNVERLWIDSSLNGEYDFEAVLASRIGVAYDEISRIFQMNDEENKSFQEIADYIEKLEFVDEELCYPSDH